MNNFGKYLKKFMEKKDLKLEYFAEELGVSFGSISHYITGRRSPSYKFLGKFYSVFSIPLEEQEKINKLVQIDKMPKNFKQTKDDLFIEHTKPIKNCINNLKVSTKEDNLLKTIDLPVFGKASAGNGYINLEEQVSSKTVIARDFSRDSFIIEVTGNSMSPQINEGEFAVVDPQESDYVANKVYVVTYNDETFIKQVASPDENIVILKSFNSEYDDIYIIGDQKKGLKIHGRVVKVISEKRF